MEVVLVVISIILGVLGVVGSIVPGLPGPPLSWAGLLIAYFGRSGSDNEVTSICLYVWLGITIVVSVLDYVIPSQITHMVGGSKTAGRGAMIGMCVGIILTPIGMIVGSLLGAFLAEFLVEDKELVRAIKSALGTFVGFVLGTGLKLIVSCTMMYFIIF